MEVELLGDRAALRCSQCPPAGVDEIDLDSTKLRLHLLLDHPESSRAARIVRFYIISMIALATFKLVMVSVRDVYLGFTAGWTFIEYWVSLSFILEFIIRWLCSASRCRFFTSLDNIIDILAILPFFLQFVPDLQHFRLFRLFRVIRVFRMLKLARHVHYIQVLRKTLKRSRDGLGLLSVFVLFATILISTIQYNVENGDWNESRNAFIRSDGTPSPFSSIPAAMYWCIETITTVGYGDVVPIEPLGKFVANIAMIVGIFVLALPLVIIASSFSHVLVEETKKKERVKKILSDDVKESLNAQKIAELVSQQRALLHGIEGCFESVRSDGKVFYDEGMLSGSLHSIRVQLDSLIDVLNKGLE
jgi:voltage-gated potassium channel Kch